MPDFDLAIANYQQSLTSFQPNVPSSTIAKVLTAYIERGMPSYMWDFGPQGFKLVGGRFEHLANGSPVTYTWFRGKQAGVMCMFRQTSGFRAPSANHIERDHLLFYRYRGYSVCLLNVGGYGDFISVIVSPIPMPAFMPWWPPPWPRNRKARNNVARRIHRNSLPKGPSIPISGRPPPME